jgi:hypothetical protein
MQAWIGSISIKLGTRPCLAACSAGWIGSISIKLGTRPCLAACSAGWICDHVRCGRLSWYYPSGQTPGSTSYQRQAARVASNKPVSNISSRTLVPKWRNAAFLDPTGDKDKWYKFAEISSQGRTPTKSLENRGGLAQQRAHDLW